MITGFDPQHKQMALPRGRFDVTRQGTKPSLELANLFNKAGLHTGSIDVLSSSFSLPLEQALPKETNEKTLCSHILPRPVRGAERRRARGQARALPALSSRADCVHLP